VHEVVDNSVDEHLAGHCSRIDVIVHFDNSVTVEDNGGGIPVDIMASENRPAAEVVGGLRSVSASESRRGARRRRRCR
jgi:DNA gyrase subunit B